jgi:FKBP-type peptidyl-prolyl cis-trans isomerase 2
MDDEQLCILTIVAGIVLMLGLVGYTIYDTEIVQKKDDKEKDTTPDIAAEGDSVSVDYVGRFTNGVVFDTSLGSVARNSSIEKSNGFMIRPTYDDLTFKIGSGQMIKGFESSVIGKQVGQTYTISVSPEQGYGIANRSLIYTIDSTITMPLVQKIDIAVFISVFPMVDLNNDTRFNHPLWGWPADVIDHDETSVTIRNLPTYDSTIKVFPWNTTVVDVSTQRNVIKLQNHVEEITKTTRVDITSLNKLDPAWFAKANGITANKEPAGFVSYSGGFIVLDFNKEVAGRTLIFEITINSITRE